ncbi:MAG: 4-(cytidine 5'-diphospho)-2-C-methyl-D-erythritol kinase [Planctomycetota bacterium]|jgi:4-diphosphocytidyl-2-C-methyl-D-erythritol kinase|nr:4-(cytidine 5'-diphospho)-2-C-methyl-D-erythritol kinase [Planctomycetota bacterium]
MSAASFAETASPAKINLFLEVAGRRPDGFHDLDSVFLEIGLADRLRAELDEPGRFSLICDYPGVPVGDENMVIRAARLLRREVGGASTPGLRFSLEKAIPPGSGLGGGSSNAAAALRLANRLWRTGLSRAGLESLGGRLGSDVPFFFRGGLCLCRGRGELITPLAGLALPAGLRICLLLSNIHSSTAAAFRDVRLPEPGRARRSEDFVRALANGDAGAAAAAVFNRFDASVCGAKPGLLALRERLARELEHGPWLSGSGSCLWFFGLAGEMAERLAADPEWLDLVKRHGAKLVDAGTARAG